MDLIKNLLHYFRKSPEETEGTAPEGTCPVCWGYQEYDTKIRTMFKDKQIDVNNHQDSYMKVQKFVVKYVDGIKLKKGKVESCPTCGGDHQKNKEDLPKHNKKTLKTNERTSSY